MKPPAASPSARPFAVGTHVLALEPILVDRADAARLCSISERKVQTLTTERRIPFKRVDTRVLYPVEALRRWALGQDEAGGSCKTASEATPSPSPVDEDAA